MILALFKLQIRTFFREIENILIGIGLPLLVLTINLMNLSEENIEAGVSIVLPIVLALNLMSVCISNAGHSHAHARSTKFLKRIQLTPIRNRDYIIAGILSQAIKAIVALVGLLIITSLLIDVNVLNINWLVFLPVFFLFFSFFYFLGMFVANIHSEHRKSANFVNMAYFAVLLFGGVIIPVVNLPDAIEIIFRALPFMYPIVLLQYAWAGESIMGIYLIVTLASTIILGGLSIKFFKFE
ncbi:MAG: ABC transporter permease [Defluviitaleaceae bacterium]|nr:ABC transporter permease [Defluviitaleaceae bacterium]